jgi:hypothetical protein
MIDYDYKQLCKPSQAGPGCAHSKHGKPELCSQCLGATVQRVSAVEHREGFGKGLLLIQKVIELDRILEVNESAQDDRSVPPT